MGENEAPAKYMIEDNAIHSSFIYALDYRKIIYADVLLYLGYPPRKLELLKIIGRSFHLIAEKLFIDFTRSKKLLSYYETKTSIKTKNKFFYNLYGMNRCDNSIIVNEKLRSLSFYLNRIPNNIELINIDYIIGTSKKRITNKCKKGYQDENKMLLIVPFSIKNKISIPKNIPFRDKVKIFNPEKFTDFFNFDNHTKDLFLCYVNLAKKSIYNDKAYKYLNKVKIESKKVLYEFKDASQKGFEDYLSSVGNLDLLNYLPDINHNYYND